MIKTDRSYMPGTVYTNLAVYPEDCSFTKTSLATLIQEKKEKVTSQRKKQGQTPWQTEDYQTLSMTMEQMETAQTLHLKQVSQSWKATMAQEAAEQQLLQQEALMIEKAVQDAGLLNLDEFMGDQTSQPSSPVFTEQLERQTMEEMQTVDPPLLDLLALSGKRCAEIDASSISGASTGGTNKRGQKCEADSKEGEQQEKEVNGD